MAWLSNACLDPCSPERKKETFLKKKEVVSLTTSHSTNLFCLTRAEPWCVCSHPCEGISPLRRHRHESLLLVESIVFQPSAHAQRGVDRQAPLDLPTLSVHLSLFSVSGRPTPLSARTFTTPDFAHGSSFSPIPSWKVKRKMMASSKFNKGSYFPGFVCCKVSTGRSRLLPDHHLQDETRFNRLSVISW